MAICFRYGAAAHTQLLGALPAILERLDRQAEVHYFGMRTKSPVPAEIRRSAVIHELPISVDRSSSSDKFLKLVLWVCLFPFIALRCRLMKIRAIWIDETIPLTATLANIFYGGRIVFTVADFFFNIYEESAPAVLKPVMRAVTALDHRAWRGMHIITRARNTGRYLERHGIPEDRWTAIYNSCDFKLFRPTDRQASRRRFGFNDDDLVLVHHGILAPNKGNDLILRALAEISADIGIIFFLVGDGPQRGVLESLTRELKLTDRVIFTGWLPSLEDVNQALNAADINLVMRTGQWSDDFHVTDTLVHGMACGLPILSARLAGIAEVIEDGKNGFLFDPRVGPEFKRKLARLAEDPELRVRFGKLARERAEAWFAIDTIAEQTAETLAAMLAEGDKS